MNYLLSKMICIQGQDRTLPFTNPRVKRQSGHYTLRAAEGAFRCGKGRPVQRSIKPVPGKAFREVEGRPTWELTMPATALAFPRGGAPISAFSRSIRRRFDAGRVNLYAANHHEGGASSTICARVKNANLATPYRSLALSRRKPNLQGTSRFRQGAVQLRSRKPTLLRNRRSGQPQGQRQARPFAREESESAKGPFKPQGGLLQGNRSAESEKIGTGEHQ